MLSVHSLSLSLWVLNVMRYVGGNDEFVRGLAIGAALQAVCECAHRVGKVDTDALVVANALSLSRRLNYARVTPQINALWV
jgi:hypothetical protein